jgi:hypothetical protein
MSALISALDIFTPTKIGENGSKEYTWSNSIRERIIQLNFQLTRTRDETTITGLAATTDTILFDLKNAYNTSSISREEYVEYMSLLYRLIGYTRDIIDGKGEYRLAYMLVNVWQKHYPELSKYAFKLFVLSPDDYNYNNNNNNNNNNNYHPYGSWKDIKYFRGKYDCPNLNNYILSLLVEQLREDVKNDNPSLAAKWVPREKSQFKDVFNELALMYFSNYIETAYNEVSYRKAVLKAKTDFRKLISSLNKKLDTVQIKQCSNNWSEIIPDKQTSITMNKQKRAFLNIKKNGEKRYDIPDRIECAETFSLFVKKAVNGEVEIKGTRVGLNDFTKEALHIISYNKQSTDEATILNAQWTNSSKQNGKLGKMIAMVDVSGSMSGDPMNAAIALGIRVAEKSLLGKRIMTFSAVPTWVNLTGHDTFIDMVSVVARADWGMNTNFASALKMILDTIISQKLTPEDVEDMVLVIFSDMQMDQADSQSLSLMDSIETQYADTGNRLWGKPFKAPHILFWNLRSTSGFPTLSTNKNCSMMSGFSPAILNLFCEEGLNALQTCTPWSLFVKSLSNKRYQPLDDKLRECI